MPLTVDLLYGKEIDWSPHTNDCDVLGTFASTFFHAIRTEIFYD